MYCSHKRFEMLRKVKKKKSFLKDWGVCSGSFEDKNYRNGQPHLKKGCMATDTAFQVESCSSFKNYTECTILHMNAREKRLTKGQ